MFSAGHDLKELKTEAGKETHAEIFRLCKEVMEKIREIDVPVIAQVSGVAAAAGCQLVAACDIVLECEKSVHNRFRIFGQIQNWRNEIDVPIFCKIMTFCTFFNPKKLHLFSQHSIILITF